MSITSQITALNADKTAIANAISAKGGTLSQNAGFDTFAADIATIPDCDNYYYEIWTIDTTAEYTKTFELDFEPKYLVFSFAGATNTYYSNLPTPSSGKNFALYSCAYVKMGTAPGQQYHIHSNLYISKDTSANTSFTVSTQSGAFTVAFNSTTNKWELTFGRTSSGSNHFLILGGSNMIYQVFVGG